MKTRLADAIVSTFADARARRASLVADPARLSSIRSAAALRARATARVVLDRARAACGVGPRG